MQRSFAALLSILPFVLSQQVGTNTAETHPPLTWQQCTAGGECTTQSSAVVLDSNWRWTHITNGYTNCYTGNTWNTTICPDDTTCAENCALDGADYEGENSVLSLYNVTKCVQAPTVLPPAVMR